MVWISVVLKVHYSHIPNRRAVHNKHYIENYKQVQGPLSQVR